MTRHVPPRRWMALTGLLAASAWLAGGLSPGLAQEPGQASQGTQAVQAAQVRAPEKARQGPPHEPAPFLAKPRVSVVTGRPGDGCVTWTALSHDRDRTVRLRLADGAGQRWQEDAVTLVQGEPRTLTRCGLQAAGWQHQWLDEDGAVLSSGQGVMPRSAGQSFRFTLTADSHLDQNTSPAQYERVLARIRDERPDLHIDLGDTFMVDKHASREAAAAQYRQQHHYFGQLGVPVFLVQGNHDGEDQKLRRQGEGNLADWAHAMRVRHFPSPSLDMPGQTYRQPQDPDTPPGGLQSRYAFQWGDALFVVLEPYWSGQKGRAAERWQLTLGTAQQAWLRQTLESSSAKHKFIFIHQLAGGIDRHGRGGMEGVPFGEWGGQDADGQPGFAQRRPGWPEPIHALLVRTGVTAVFHGHDHLYASQMLDGVAYVEVPQPAHPGGDRRDPGGEYGYRQGTVLGASGHLRVSVEPGRVVAELIDGTSPQPQVLHRSEWRRP